MLIGKRSESTIFPPHPAYSPDQNVCDIWGWARLEIGLKNLRDSNGEVLEPTNDPDEFWDRLCKARDQITQQEINTAIQSFWTKGREILEAEGWWPKKRSKKSK